MTKTTIAAGLTAALFCMTGPALSAPDILDLPKRAQGETLGTAADGAQPYYAVIPLVCDESSCSADFGKKNNKTRTIDWVSCGLLTGNGTLQVAAPILNTITHPIAYMSVVSRAMDGATETAIFEFRQRFDVPPGDKLGVFTQTSGDAIGGQCVVSGTIR